MQIVPVIDIRNGAVVRARAGARDAYRPMSSPLAATSAPPDIVAGFLTLHPFKKIYVADLDAIQETGDNQRQIAALIDSFPALCFMIDAGGTSLRWRGAARTECVIGSESLRDSESLRALKDAPNTLLSLDFRDEAFLGPDALDVRADLWPRQIIVMTLTRVGVSAGPDLARLSQIVGRAGDRRVYAAGGVRDARDLAQVEAIGAAGALVATALHDGALSRADLERFAAMRQQKREPREAPLAGELSSLSSRRMDVSR